MKRLLFLFSAISIRFPHPTASVHPVVLLSSSSRRDGCALLCLSAAHHTILELHAIGSLYHCCLEAPAPPWPIVNSDLHPIIGADPLHYIWEKAQELIIPFRLTLFQTLDILSLLLKALRCPGHLAHPLALVPVSKAPSCIRQSNDSRGGEQADCAYCQTF